MPHDLHCVMATHLHLLTTLRLEHIAHVLLLPCLLLTTLRLKHTVHVLQLPCLPLSTLRLKHTAHVLPLPHLPLSLTPVLPVIFILTAEISPHSIPLPLGLSMDSEKEAGQLKDAAKPNWLPSSLP